MDNSKNTKELFRIVNNLTGCNTHNPLPPAKKSEEIAEGFAEFFSDKITKIWQSFTCTLQYHPEETQIHQNLQVFDHSQMMKSREK